MVSYEDKDYQKGIFIMEGFPLNKILKNNIYLYSVFQTSLFAFLDWKTTAGYMTEKESTKVQKADYVH